MLLPIANQAKAQETTADPDPFAAALLPPPTVQIQVELIEVTHETLTNLMFMRHPQADAAPLREQVQALVKKSEARVIETLIAVSPPNEKVSVESIREFIYPTEYEPAEIPDTVRSQGSKVSDLAGLMTPPNPCAFETRNVGSMLEAEATLQHGGTEDFICLRLSPTIVANTGNTSWVKLKDRLGNINEILMPAFYANQLSVKLTLRDGTYGFAGAMTPKGDDGEADYSKKWMVFVKADLL